MRTLLPGCTLIALVGCGTTGDGVGGLPLSEPCATYQSYVEDSCGLDFTDALAEACEARLSQIASTCSSDEANT